MDGSLEMSEEPNLGPSMLEMAQSQASNFMQSKQEGEKRENESKVR